VKSYFDQGGESVLVSRVVSGSAGWTRAASTTIASQTGSIENPFTISTIGKGALYSNNSGSSYNSGGLEENTDGSLKSGSADNIRWEISNVDSGSGTFTLAVRAGNDSINNKIKLRYSHRYL